MTGPVFWNCQWKQWGQSQVTVTLGLETCHPRSFSFHCGLGHVFLLGMNPQHQFCSDNSIWHWIDLTGYEVCSFQICTCTAASVRLWHGHTLLLFFLPPSTTCEAKALWHLPFGPFSYWKMSSFSDKMKTDNWSFFPLQGCAEGMLHTQMNKGFQAAAMQLVLLV